MLNESRPRPFTDDAAPEERLKFPRLVRSKISSIEADNSTVMLP